MKSEPPSLDGPTSPLHVALTRTPALISRALTPPCPSRSPCPPLAPWLSQRTPLGPVTVTVTVTLAFKQRTRCIAPAETWCVDTVPPKTGPEDHLPQPEKNRTQRCPRLCHRLPALSRYMLLSYPVLLVCMYFRPCTLHPALHSQHNAAHHPTTMPTQPHNPVVGLIGT